MKLAKLVGDGCLPWTLYDGTRVHISPGTIVQYERGLRGRPYKIYFPGYSVECRIAPITFDWYFEPL